VSYHSVKEIMVPLAEYATVPVGSNLLEAMIALEKVQEEFIHNKHRHRGIVIIDKEKGVIGKLGQMDVLRALEPKKDDDDEVESLGQFGFSAAFMRNRRKQKRLAATPIKDLCRTVSKLRVEDFMQTLSEGEIIDEEASLEVAIQQMVVGNHLLSLLVTRGQTIVGVLRMTDVFAAVFHAAKECVLPTA